MLGWALVFVIGPRWSIGWERYGRLALRDDLHFILFSSFEGSAARFRSLKNGMDKGHCVATVFIYSTDGHGGSFEYPF